VAAHAWVPHRVVNGVPYDTPILGYRVNTANTLRLWKAEAPESFDFRAVQTAVTTTAAGECESDVRESQQGSLSERRSRGGQRAAPRAAVFLRVLLTAGTCCAFFTCSAFPVDRLAREIRGFSSMTRTRRLRWQSSCACLVDERGHGVARGVAHHVQKRSATRITRCWPEALERWAHLRVRQGAAATSRDRV